jgi:glycosyltransferase involved in cell wall biosynthesis
MLWGSVAAKYANIKSLINAVCGLGILYTDGFKSAIKRLLPVILRKVLKRENSIVIFQNMEDRNLFISRGIVGEWQCRYIKGSGIDLKEFAYTPEPEEGKVRVMFAARMIEEKGVFVLVDAAKKLREKYYDRVQFILCGMIDNNPKSISKETLKAMCDGEYIQWLGHRTDILNILQGSHIVALPSYYREGLPKSLIEAAAVGRPIITTDAVGCRDTVEDGYNGFIVPVKDSDALAEKLSILIENKDLRVEMGRNSRKLAERDFSIDNVVAQHLEIYRTLTF